MMKGLSVSDQEFALNLRKLRDAGERDLVVSPINLSIVDRNVLKLPQLKWFNFHLMPSKVKVTNTGHTVILSAKWLGKRPHINQGPLDGDYVFSQIHFHWGQTDDSGSEHLVDGKQYPLEMHVVYFKSDYGQQAAAIRQKDGLLVVGYFFKIEDVANATLADVLFAFPRITRPNTSARVNVFRPDRLCRPFRDDYFLYHGSVSSAACNHQVLWAFNREPISVSSQQVASFRQLLDHTGAPLMTHTRQADPSSSHAIFHVNPSHIRSGILYPLSSAMTPARVAGSSLAGDKHASPAKHDILYPLPSAMTPARVAGSSLATVSPVMQGAGLKQGRRNASLASSSRTSPPAPLLRAPPPLPARHSSTTQRSLQDSLVLPSAKKRWVSARSRSPPEPLPPRRMKPPPARPVPSVRQLLPPDVVKFRRDVHACSTSTRQTEVDVKESPVVPTSTTKAKASPVVAETNMTAAISQVATSNGTDRKSRANVPPRKAVGKPQVRWTRLTKAPQTSMMTSMINEPWKKMERPTKASVRQWSQAGTELGPEQDEKKLDSAVSQREELLNGGQRTDEAVVAKPAFPSWTMAHSVAISKMVNYCKKLKLGKSDLVHPSKTELKAIDEHGTVVAKKAGDETSKSSPKKKVRLRRKNSDEDRQSLIKRPLSTSVEQPLKTSSLHRQSHSPSKHRRSLSSTLRRDSSLRQRLDLTASNANETPNRSLNNSAVTGENLAEDLSSTRHLQKDSQVTVLMSRMATSETGNTSAAGIAALASRLTEEAASETGKTSAVGIAALASRLTEEAAFRSAWARGSVAQASRHHRRKHSAVKALDAREDTAEDARQSLPTTESLLDALTEESSNDILGASASRRNSENNAGFSRDDKRNAFTDCRNWDNATDPSKRYESLYFIPYKTPECKDEAGKTLKTVDKFKGNSFSDNSALRDDMNNKQRQRIGKSSNVAIEAGATPIANRSTSRKSVELPKRCSKLTHQISPDFDLVQDSVCYINSETSRQCALGNNVQTMSDLLKLSLCKDVSSVGRDSKMDAFPEELLESILRNNVGRNIPKKMSSRNLQATTLVYTAAEPDSVSWPPAVQRPTRDLPQPIVITDVTETSDKQSSCDVRTSRENDVNRLREGRSLWPSRPLCWGRGKLQSPISFKRGLAQDVTFPPLVFRHHFNTVGQATLRNHGNRAEMTFTCQNQPFVRGGPLVDGSYVFESLIIHWHNSESSANRHSVDNHFYTTEVHLVHFLNTWGSYENALHEPHGLAIIAFFLESGCTEDLFFEDLISALAKITRPQASTKLSVETMKFLEHCAPPRGYFAYPGSMTDHPHADDVVWIVYPRPVMVSRGQIEAFRTLSNHARSFTKPIDRCQQPLNERPVFYAV